jgi:hypothetical protein
MANSLTRVKVGNGRICQVSKASEIQIETKAVFKFENNRQYRKLLELFASGDAIACQTSAGVTFRLEI